MTFPVANPRVTQAWGRPNPRYKAGRHTGIDFGMPVGTSLFSVVTGTVVDVSFDNSYGNKVVVEYTHNGVKYQDLYCHLTNANVKKGDSVRPGQQIAVSGNTGNSTGPHLHLETRIAPFRYGNDVAHPSLEMQGIVDSKAPASAKPSVVQKVASITKPAVPKANKVVNLKELMAGQADDVTLVQSALDVKVTGKWDTATTTAYKKWQESLGFKGNDADGKPGKTSLARLGSKYGFTVI